ncbi:hypothetical protein SEUCBS139899_007433 [Sporothrix eucalyptigena]|uniref:SHSP domain-containing protein n=1 Tax=Sporothrix eucalyptigena TaxID=1812306 RepID=A0ABP0B9W4_9PEZI
MPFFPRAFFNPVNTAPADQFTNFFQLINEIDQAASVAAKQQQAQELARQEAHQAARRERQQQCQAACAARQQVARQQKHQHRAHHNNDSFASFFGLSRPFNPRFDVRETESTYELHGELAGVERNNVNLEFTEPQTLVISGSVERNYSSNTPADVEAAPAAAPEAVPEAIADTHSEPSDDDEPILRDGARTPVDEDEPFEIVAPRTPSPARSHRATVTDEATEDALERGEDITNEKAAAPAEAEVADPAVVTPGEVEAEQTQTEAQTAPTERYWVQERAVGQFKRVFNFPVPVDEANVRANLENGILSVSIPKAKREVRRIVVF